MSAHKHTQGPWQVIGTMVRGRYALGENNRPGGLIADCGGYYTPETHANARLIAAAPELMEALRLAMEWNWLDDDARPSRVAEICDAAIAKATGESA